VRNCTPSVTSNESTLANANPQRILSKQPTICS